MRFDLHPFEDLEAARQWARDEVDSAAAAARARFITLTPGQETTYRLKYAEALAFADGDPAGDVAAFPWIAAEALRAGLPLSLVADRIKRKGDLWNQVYGPRIEAMRVAAKDQLAGLVEISQVVKAAHAAVSDLQQVRETAG